MKKITLLVLSISGLTTTSFGKKFSVHHPEMKALWGDWKKNHTKNYADHEEPTKMSTFVENYNMIHEFNSNPNNTATLAINHFADLTEEEFRAQYTGYHPGNHSEKNLVEEKEDDERNLASLPSSVDWRTKGAVTPVKNQGSCNGCWAFSATGALEGLHKIKTGKLQSYSEQQLLNCNTASKGCAGGHTSTAFSYTAKYGVELESTNPSVGTSGRCNFVSTKASKVNTGHVSVPAKNMNALLAAVVKQPVSIALNGETNALRFYKSGVLTSNCPSATNHAVLIVGYTTVNGHQALIVKNSWGPSWGNKGYVYISTNSAANGGYGVCGVLNGGGYPTA